MISKQSISLAELIVAGTDLPDVKSGALIRGLNQEVVGAVGYTDDFRNEIIQTTQNTAHTALLDLTSDKLAEVIRDAMYNIRDYGVPFARRVAKDIRFMYSSANLAEMANARFSIRYVPIDNAFFDSPLYPTSVSDKLLSYEAVNLDMLLSLKVNYPTNEEVLKFIGTSHQDLNAILEDTEHGLPEMAVALLDINQLARYFEKQGGVFNFKKIKGMDVSALVKMYVILTRMYASDDPAPWLVGGELASYRRAVNLLWNGMTAYLIELKALFTIYKARKVVISYTEAPSVTNDDWSGRKLDAKLMKASVRVLYTKDFLNELGYKSLSFNEVITGYAWSQLAGNPATIADVINQPEKVADFAKQYYVNIDRSMKNQARQQFVATGVKAINDFLFETPVVSDRFKEVVGSKELPLSWINKTFSVSLEECYHRVAELQKDSSVDTLILEGDGGENPFFEAILQSNLVADFLGSLKCTLAAEIVNATFVTRNDEDNIHDKRQRLHVALINLIVSKSIETA